MLVCDHVTKIRIKILQLC